MDCMASHKQAIQKLKDNAIFFGLYSRNLSFNQFHEQLVKAIHSEISN